MKDMTLATPPKNYQFWIKRATGNDNLYLFAALIAYMALASFLAPNFASLLNLSIVLEQLAVPGILAVGMTMLMISGGIDLSIGSQVSFAACFIALLITKGLPVPLAILAGIVLCIACSFVSGLIISRTKLEPFIVTLAAMIVFKGCALITTSGAEFPIPDTMGFATSIRYHDIPFMVYVMVVTFLVFGWIIRYTKFGRWLFAVGDNPNAAYLAGIDVRNFKLLVYMINGLLVSIGTILILSRNEVGNPYLGTDLEMRSIAAAVVGGTALSGGKGNLLGTFLGTVLMGIISNSLNVIGVSSFWQYVVTGGVIVVAVLLNSLKSGIEVR